MTFYLVFCSNRTCQNIHPWQEFSQKATHHDHLLTIHNSSEKKIQKIFQCQRWIISSQFDLACDLYCCWLLQIVQISKLWVRIRNAKGTIKNGRVLMKTDVNMSKDGVNHSCQVKNTSGISLQGYKSNRVYSMLLKSERLWYMLPWFGYNRKKLIF